VADKIHGLFQTVPNLSSDRGPNRGFFSHNPHHVGSLSYPTYGPFLAEAVGKHNQSLTEILLYDVDLRDTVDEYMAVLVGVGKPAPPASDRRREK
jgi:hypothetical protein